MVSVKQIPVLMLGVWVGFTTCGGRAGSVARDDRHISDLFEHASGEVLLHHFTKPDVSYLLLDADSGRVLAARWDAPSTPIPLGSLVKPFTALAYGERHNFKYPVYACRGSATGCWLPAGHGELDLTRAIAYSCNSYFRMLTRDLGVADVSPTATRFGLEPPDPEVTGPALVGLGRGWRISPLRMATAYVELVRRRDQPGVREILAGMAQSAQRGTGRQVNRYLPFTYALVKTGTAPCTHLPNAVGDGFTVALTPVDRPQLLLLVRVHGVPGVQAAKTAGEMLQRIEY